jgi:transcriptional regulator with XRE-family HTH domain
VAIYRAMTGAELRNIREAFGLSASVMGRALGYSGPKANVAVQIRRLERDARPIPPSVKRLAQMYARHGIPKEWCVR